MSQCVPSWGLDDNPDPRKTTMRAHSGSISTTPGVPTLDYEVTELTWENGQLAMHGLGPPRVPNKFQGALSVSKYTWEKPRAGETLEAIVNQATLLPHQKLLLGGGSEELVPWLDCHGTSSARVSGSISASATMTMDALVPSSHTDDPSTIRPLHCSGSTRVGSCSAIPALDEGRVTRVTHEYSRDSGSATFGMGSSQQMTIDTCKKELGTRGLTSTSIGSFGNTSSAKQCTKSTTPDDHDSVCHSRSQVDEVVEGKKKGKGKSSLSTKRSRAAAIHNQSERKRRDRINQRMKTLQKMVPNSSKTDKASMLDEVIEYLKQLQAQVQMMSRMSMPPMMLPLAMQQQLHMSMMNPMNMGMGMGMGMGVMDLNTIGRSNMTPILHPSAFMPLATWEGPNNVERFQMTHPLSLMHDPLSAFLACQSQPMTMEACTRMAALFQQMHQQPPGPGPKN